MFCFQVHASRLAFNLESLPIFSQISGDNHHDRLQPICGAFKEFSFSDSDFFFRFEFLVLIGNLDGFSFSDSGFVLFSGPIIFKHDLVDDEGQRSSRSLR